MDTQSAPAEHPAPSKPWYPPLASFSLALFIALLASHIGVMTRLIVVPGILFVPAFLLIIPGQVLVILELSGGSLWRGRSRWLPKHSSFDLAWAGFKKIPPAWRWTAVGYFYVYVPVTFIRLFMTTAQSSGEAAFPEPAEFFAPILAVFALAHFLAFRFVLPKRAEILEEVAGPRSR